MPIPVHTPALEVATVTLYLDGVAVMFTVLAETAALLTSAEFLAQPSQPGDLGPIIDRATGWLVGILAAVATLFLTLGGVRYVLAGGDPQQVEAAKKSLRNALVGYAFAALAPLVLAIVRMILGV